MAQLRKKPIVIEAMQFSTETRRGAMTPTEPAAPDTRPRRYVFEYAPNRNEWSVRSTGDDDEIVFSRGFDGGFRVLAAWVMEREAFTRFGRDERWERVENEDGEMSWAYGPAERLINGPQSAPRTQEDSRP